MKGSSKRQEKGTASRRWCEPVFLSFESVLELWGRKKVIPNVGIALPTKEDDESHRMRVAPREKLSPLGESFLFSGEK